MLEVPAGLSKNSFIPISLMWRSREGSARCLFIDAVQKLSSGGGCIGPAVRKLCSIGNSLMSALSCVDSTSY